MCARHYGAHYIYPVEGWPQAGASVLQIDVVHHLVEGWPQAGAPTADGDMCSASLGRGLAASGRLRL